ncbi:MAG TPA: CHAT domain-containing protein [Waterburya sp.]|jgi:hypothetical protein
MPSKFSKIDQVAVAHEFNISVTPLGEDEYLVRIERVAPGVPLAEEQVRWPVEDWLAQARQLMNDPLLGFLQGTGELAEDVFFLSEWDEPTSPAARNLVELGHKLYNSLFQGSLRDSWMMAQAIAQNQRKILRLRLGLKGTRLPRLPWEVLHAGDRPLATGTDVTFSRYQLNVGHWRPSPSFFHPPNQPLKILMVISGPSDQETLELAQEASHLQEELRNRSSYGPPAIQLTILEQPGREQLTQALEQGQYQVFHYAGHSNLGESGGDVYLVSNKTGLTETLNGDDLAGLLVNNGVQLAVFNSCRGAYTATSKGVDNGQERNLAEALVRRGIPSVLAMAERIPDAVALTLTRLLYRNLNQGYPIDLSLSRARQGLISAYGSNQLYWALPVLYLHPEFNGFLTNDTPENQEELFTLPAPPDTPFPQAQEVSFTPPSRSSLSPIPKDDDEPDNLFPGLDSEEADEDDPSAFIKDLLGQLTAESANSESTPPPLDTDNRSRAGAQVPSWELPANPRNPTPTPRAESATNPAPEPTEASLSPDVVPTHPSQTSGRRQPKGLRSWRQKFQRVPKLWVILGATGILAIALLGVWFFQSRNSLTGDVSKSDSSIPTLPKSDSQIDDVGKADTAKVTALAIEQFSQGNIATGQKTVEELLNREALQSADAALAVVPKARLDDPAVSFLRGRLAWQSLKKGSKDYDLSDARRYWETAHKNQPKSATYLMALGFAYYAEGNYERANNAWFDALTLIQKAPGTVDAASNSAKKQELTTYAGLALGLRQSAQKQPPEQRRRFLSESMKLRQKVMTDDPVNFQPVALSKHWLWTDKTIQDWRSLLAAK